MMIDIISGVVTVVFFLFLLSYYLLFLIPRKKPTRNLYKNISIIIPARNEQKYIAQAVQHVKNAVWDGHKQIIVVNDASKDNTKKIISRIKGITVINNEHHSGKSASLNSALKIATGEVIAIVDGDSFIDKNSLQLLSQEISIERVGAASSVISVANRHNIFGMWLHIEVIYTSLIRALFTRIGANVVTPGALSLYRADILRESGGFSTEGFAEDADIAIRFHRKGFHSHIVEEAMSYTNMPCDIKGFFRQRFRLARGLIKLLKTHLRLNRTIIDLYTLPLFLFSYVQSVIMGTITLWQIGSGYFTYYYSQGEYISMRVVGFFIDWLSFLGFFKWTIRVFSGVDPLTFFAMVGIASTLLSYPLFVYAFLKYDKKIDFFHILGLFFISIYWLINMIVYILCIPELFKKKQFNIWKKNE